MKLRLNFITIIVILLVGCNKEITYKPLNSHSNFPIPKNAKVTKGNANNPNIEKYVKYKWKEADEIKSIPTSYLKEIKSKEWVELEEDQLGAVRFFEKNGTVVALSTHDGFITLSKMKKDTE